MFLRFYLILCLALCCDDLTAQTISTKIRFVSWKANSPSAFSFMQKEKRVDVEGIQESIRSQMIAYTGPPTLSLFPLGSGDKPEEKPQPIANIPIPPSVKFPLIILIPNPDGPTPPYRGIVFEDDPAEFPFPSYSLVNFSHQNIAVELGGKQFVIEPGKKNLVTSKDKVVNMRIAIPKGENSKWSIIYDNFFPNWPEERNLFFILDVTKNGNSHLEVRSLLENKSVWKKTQQPKADSPSKSE